MGFNEDSFRSSVSFPSYRIFKQNKLWVAELYIAEELYSYRYPFNFNRFFLTYPNKYGLIVKLQIINAFSQKRLLKEFDLKALLQQQKRSGSQLK